MQVRVLQEIDEQRYRALRFASIEEVPTYSSPEIVRELSLFVRSPVGVLGNHALEGTRVWGVDAGECLVGAVAATRASFGRPGTAHLWGLYVAPEVRGAGVGARLLLAALEWLRRRSSAQRVVLYANRHHDHDAIRLFGRSGFEAVPDEVLRRTRLCAMRLDLRDQEGGPVVAAHRGAGETARLRGELQHAE